MPTLADLQVLPADMRGLACGPIFDVLKANRGQAVSFNGAEVVKMDTIAAQLFVLAAKTWANDDEDFQIVDPSEQFRGTMKCLGLADMVKMESSSDDN